MALSKGGGGGGGKLEDTIIRYVAARSSGNTAATRLNDTSAASGNALSNASAASGNTLSNASRGYENDVIAFQQKVADRKPAQTQPTVKEYMQERDGGNQPGLKAAGYYQVPLPANATGTAVRSAESKYGGDVYGPTPSRGYESDVMAFQQNIANRQAIPQWESPGWGAASQNRGYENDVVAFQQNVSNRQTPSAQTDKPAFDPMKVAVGNNVDNNAIMEQRAQENARNSWNPLTPRVAIDGPRPWSGTNDVNAMTFAKRSGGMEQQYRLHRRIQEEIYMRNGQPAMRQYPRPITDRVSSGTASSVARNQGDK